MIEDPNLQVKIMAAFAAEKKTLNDSLQQILTMAREKDSVPIRALLTSLAGRGYPALLIILSIPFCFPINIPGFSTPFGIILAFIGLRMACAKRPWWPKKMLDKSIPSKRLIKVIQKAISIVHALRKVLRRRLNFLTEYPYVRRMNGLLIAILAVLLSLPLPIPLTNMLCAFPILCFGLGMLEDDGLAILLGYVLTLLCFSMFILLFLAGKSILLNL